MRLIRNAALLAAFCAALSGSALAATYPDPPPDFSHPGRTHYGEPLFSRAGGQADRGILVIYIRWDDVDYPPAFDAATVSRRFFGTGFPGLSFPSVSNYFFQTSFGDMYLPWVPESQGAVDGVVQVHYPGTKASFLATPFGVRNKKLLELANDFVDFDDLDLDGNNRMDNDELIVNAYEAAPETPMWKGCGVQAGTAAVSLDGVALGGLKVAMTNTATNLITIIHENAHVALGMKDLYGFDTRGLDIGAATCEAPTEQPDDGRLFAPNAWHKLHWGWIAPTVVVRDGYYDVRRADTTGDAFILYDPDRGTDDYFIVENRTMTAGTYDQRASGRGLVIWRVADHAFGVDTGFDPIGMMKQDVFRTAWDAAAYQAAPRTMTAPWSDGAATSLAVRSIGRAGEVMRAYFDVRGPGFLVDPYPVDLNGPIKLTAGSSGSFTVPVMNTNEADPGCDTFRVEPVGLPAGWTMSPSGRILCSGEQSVWLLEVRPDANAAPGPHTISVQGRSLTNENIVTTAPLNVEVVLRKTKFHLGELVLAAPTAATGTFQVRVSDEDDPGGTRRSPACPSRSRCPATAER